VEVPSRNANEEPPIEELLKNHPFSLNNNIAKTVSKTLGFASRGPLDFKYRGGIIVGIGM
jgi:hypothetical protein